MNIFLYFLPWGSFYCFSTYMYFLRWRMKAILLYPHNVVVWQSTDRLLNTRLLPGISVNDSKKKNNNNKNKKYISAKSRTQWGILVTSALNCISAILCGTRATRATGTEIENDFNNGAASNYTWRRPKSNASLEQRASITSKQDKNVDLKSISQ